MSQELWTAVDQYLVDSHVHQDAALTAALRASEAAGLPTIQVSATQGKLLSLLARVSGARRILEIGTLGGYSAIWLARALPADGKLITLEADPKHADVARASIEEAGLGDRVEVRLGRAFDGLAKLREERAEPFDFTFIDADKENIPAYFTAAIELSRPGGIIVVDNVVRRGAIVDETSTDVNVLGVRRFHELLSKERRVSATTVQTVGSKGYDGLTLAVIGAPT